MIARLADDLRTGPGVGAGAACDRKLDPDLRAAVLGFWGS